MQRLFKKRLALSRLTLTFVWKIFVYILLLKKLTLLQNICHRTADDRSGPGDRGSSGRANSAASTRDHVGVRGEGGAARGGPASERHQRRASQLQPSAGSAARSLTRQRETLPGEPRHTSQGTPSPQYIISWWADASRSTI